MPGCPMEFLPDEPAEHGFACPVCIFRSEPHVDYSKYQVIVASASFAFPGAVRPKPKLGSLSARGS